MLPTTGASGLPVAGDRRWRNSGSRSDPLTMPEMIKHVDAP